MSGHVGIHAPPVTDVTSGADAHGGAPARPPRLHLILARAANGVIGVEGRLPWHLPADLAHFKAKTLGCPVLMGRKTWESLPPRFRPLPGRINVVMTRQAGWQADGALSASSLRQALQLPGVQGAPDIWVIGGAKVYQQTLPHAHSAEITEIHAVYEGDAFAPDFGPTWHETDRQAQEPDNGLSFDFVRLENGAPSPLVDIS